MTGLSTVPPAYWSVPPATQFAVLGSTATGISARDAKLRLARDGANVLEEQQRLGALSLLFQQFRSPLVVILIFAAAVSALVSQWLDAAVVIAVVLGSTLLGFVQEYAAGNAIEKLRAQITVKTKVLRDGQPLILPSRDVVAGDIVLLEAGSLIPADGVVCAAKDFFVNQAVLTGESFPVEKSAAVTAADAGLAERTNCVFMGTNVRSGTARVLIVLTGRRTVFGQVADKLRLRPPLTEFERGIQRFGYLLTRVMVVMVAVVFAINVFFDKPPIDSLLFALALAVGLTPELLPAIISITLAHGAKRMAAGGVLVRRLNAIENFGSMDVLCTDKTGTLTEGVVRLDRALDVDGAESATVLALAMQNASFQTGLNNGLDDAVIARARSDHVELAGATKIDEIPYDFARKCLSVVSADTNGVRTLITKGALINVLGFCTQVAGAHGAEALDAARRAAIETRYRTWSEQGFRVLGIAARTVEPRAESYTRADEQALVLQGFLLFFDAPKADVAQTITDLARRGVALKIITGDNQHVARHIAEAVQLPLVKMMTGRELNALSDEALWHAAERTTVFAEVDPNQKERVILALKKTGHVVGYMGDGINDAPAMHAADVGISVDTAADVAKDAADFVLLKKDLDILRAGIDEGRATFANTMKYILTTISANFGNMFSMAAISIFLPFLPLLASQILLNNFLSDIPATAIANDNVDPEWVARPQRWDTVFVRNYMVLFGLVSSLFDFLAFAALLFVFKASPEEFRTGWFVESLLTELVIALVVRTRRLCLRSRPGKWLMISTVLVVGVTLALPYLPFNSLFGFVPLPPALLLTMVALTTLYVVAAEFAKAFFYARLVQPGH